LHSHGCIQPFEQPGLETLEYRNLARILTRCKLERTSRLLQEFDEPLAIKDHGRPYRRSHPSLQPGGVEKWLSAQTCFAILARLSREGPSLQIEGGRMARKCEICAKAPMFGHNISHAHNVTNRRWTPNIQRVKVRLEGKVRRIRICTRCLRSGKVEKVV
jgi:large subunit ribosomal protein L28